MGRQEQPIGASLPALGKAAYEMTITREQIPFPCRSVPEDPSLQKLIGLYPQAQEGLMLQRVKVPGGRLSAEQWRLLGAIAMEFTPDTPLHLTTRQDIELHDLAPEQIPPVQERLSRIALTCLGAAGDSFRNITVCPCAGTAAGSVDLMPLAGQIEDAIKAVDGIYRLPRKFKIALSCGADCGQPWINDLGLVAERRNGAWGFRAVAAGSLGAKPGTGMLLFDWLAAEDVLPLAVAAVCVFAHHGDRQNRHKARLRHVRRRLGNEAFKQLIVDALELARAEPDWPRPILPEADGRFAAKATLTFPNGDVTPRMADALGQIEADDDFSVRIANQHQVIVFGPDEEAVGWKLAEFEPLRAAAETQPSVVACPGKRWCSRGLVHTNELADRIRAEFGSQIPRGATVCISGCPNGCSQSAVADIGLIGGRARRNGRSCEVFTLMTGGGMGSDEKLAEPLAGKLNADEAIEAIRKHLGSARPGGSNHG